MDSLRNKMKEILKEKIEIEFKFNHLQKNELSRLSDLEQKFEEISTQYIRCKEELTEVRRVEIGLKNEL